ncbi:MAG: ATP-NAD kinase family protein [Clostridia bacterium]
MRQKLGFIVNPIAGMGGKVGLKGTDGDALKEALKLGAEPESPRRARLALDTVRRLAPETAIMTGSGIMGEDAARCAGFEPDVALEISGDNTDALDTRALAQALEREGVDLILFVGGDGTARDIMDAVDERVPVIGTPAGVKMHSAVFATDPRSAGEISVRYLDGDISLTREAEVMDIDEDAFRDGRLSAKLYGHVMTPYDPHLVQDLKMGSTADQEAAAEAIAERVVEGMAPDTLYIIGPGTTTRRILDRMNLPATLLGVDLVKDGEIVGADVNEIEILDQLSAAESSKIVVTLIGGQGYIFGRGNQQISPEVIKRVGRENIIVVAAKGKLLSLGRKPLLVDTGDIEVDEMLRGYISVLVDYREDAVRQVR